MLNVSLSLQQNPGCWHWWGEREVLVWALDFMSKMLKSIMEGKPEVSRTGQLLQPSAQATATSRWPVGRGDLTKMREPHPALFPHWHLECSAVHLSSCDGWWETQLCCLIHTAQRISGSNTCPPCAETRGLESWPPAVTLVWQWHHPARATAEHGRSAWHPGSWEASSL